MQTTLAIDDDVLEAAEAIARERNSTVGEVISDLARRALDRPPPAETRNGVPLLPMRPDAQTVTLDMVNALRDELL